MPRAFRNRRDFLLQSSAAAEFVPYFLSKPRTLADETSHRSHAGPSLSNGLRDEM